MDLKKKKTAIISLYSINWLVSITETECVYCAVRTGYLNTFHVHLTTRRPNFDSSPFHVRFVVDNVALGQVSLRVLNTGEG